MKYKQPISKYTNVMINDGDKPSYNHKFDINYDILKEKIEKDIDSILFTYNIKKDWIITSHPGDKTSKIKPDKTKKESQNVQWFTKNVIIPKDITSSEINLDISNYLYPSGLRLGVDEEIRSTNIAMTIFPPEDTLMISTPLAKISIVHSDKIQRETGTYVIILNNIWDYKTDELDQMLNIISEFSFIFPKNLDQIDLQNKLIQMKKDVLINLTIGDKNNSEADFNVGMENKDIKQNVKSFNIDFPYIKTVLLSTIDRSAQDDKLINNISAELSRYDIKTISDTLFIKLGSKDDDIKHKINSIINIMKTRINDREVLFGITSLSHDEFKNFYEEVLALKKAGYRFYSLSQFLSKQDERKKKEEVKEKESSKEKSKKENIRQIKPKSK